MEDMIQHAILRRSPMPVVRLDRQGRLVRRDVREAKVAVESGRLAPSAVTVLLPVQDDEDWRPYAALGLIPLLPDAVLTAASALELERLCFLLAYGKAPAGSLEALAQQRTEARRWELALARATTCDGLTSTIGSQTLIEALHEHLQTTDFAHAVRTLLTGDAQAPAWWDGGRWILAAHACGGLRLAVLLESVLEQASAPAVGGEPKFLLIDGDLIAEDRQGCAAVERLMRTGRKHHLFVVVLVSALVPAFTTLGDLAGNWLTTHAARAALPIERAAPGAAACSPPPQGWWQSSLTPLPQAVGSWFTADEVAAGDRLLSGASHAKA
ncbi:MAG TPA: hypothetical protein VHX44_02100, partial [Planctomycetota bacterium]|nr:hypothetical protein [Planctomycetota bacterium]